MSSDPNTQRRPRLSLVVPLYNEQIHIPVLRMALQEFREAFVTRFPSEQYELVLVDDGSTDQTAALLHEFAMTLDEDAVIVCQVLQQEKNGGKGAALKAGVLAATGRWVLTLDADMATRPSQLLDWQQHGWVDLDQDHASVVFIGSREHPDSQVQDSSARRFIGRVFNGLIRMICGLCIADTQCGFKLYPFPLAQVLFSRLIHIGWAHDVELLLRAQHLGCRIVSLPIAWTAGTQSKIHVATDAIMMFLALFAIRWRVAFGKPQAPSGRADI